MLRGVVTNNFEETRLVGESLSKELKGGVVLALYGNLGSGKTTFVQGLAKGLGIVRNIISPTFIVVRKYELVVRSQTPVVRSFYHIDLYRIEDEKDIVGLGLEEIINDPENIVAIEWPEKIESILPINVKRIYFQYLKGDKRKIEIK